MCGSFREALYENGGVLQSVLRCLPKHHLHVHTIQRGWNSPCSWQSLGQGRDAPAGRVGFVQLVAGTSGSAASGWGAETRSRRMHPECITMITHTISYPKLTKKLVYMESLLYNQNFLEFAVVLPGESWMQLWFTTRLGWDDVLIAVAMPILMLLW